MKTGIIIWSHRHDSQSAKVAKYIEWQITGQTYILDLGKEPLPLWEESIWSGDEKWDKILAPIHEELQLCESFVIVAPEYSGMVPAWLKNFFLLADGLAHKPAMIIWVSSGRGGRYPITELRMSSYKNTKIVYVPDHMYIDNCQDVLNDAEPDGKSDTYIRDRIEYSLSVLGEYAVALKWVRESGKTETEKYGYGM